MSQRGRELSDELTVFNQEVIAFVENCSEADWQKHTPSEGWPVGVTARHIAAGHFGVLDWAKMIVSGQPLPKVTYEAIDSLNAQHAREHAHATKEEVLELLHRGGGAVSDYARSLSDEDLDRTGHLSLTGGDVSTEGFMRVIMIDLGRQHLNSLREAVSS